MKIVTVVGARPQFIKVAVVSDELRKHHSEVLVHTGQHYDYNMSEQFFEELQIPKPDYNLGISGGTHAQMTAKMMIAIEDVLKKEKPDWVLVYGDTNSTLAASIAAAKLYIKICHVEAGIRTKSMTNPEEINRICTDHVSLLLLSSTQSGLDNLKLEGLDSNAYMVGDPMYDAYIKYSKSLNIAPILQTLDGKKYEIDKNYYYLTCHREENTNDAAINEIFKAMDSLEHPTIYPVHPRNKKRASQIKKDYNFSNIVLVEPVGYLESLYLLNNSYKVVTDSGGLQREAFFAEKKCVTILDFVCWPETMVENRNNLSKPTKDNIIRELSKKQHIDKSYKPFGDGCAAKKIVNIFERMA